VRFLNRCSGGGGGTGDFEIDKGLARSGRAK
jgi:hypothetical protein